MKKFVASPNNNISKFHISLYIVQRIYRYIRGAEIFLSICVKKTANLNILCRVLLQDTFRGARNFHPEISRKKSELFFVFSPIQDGKVFEKSLRFFDNFSSASGPRIPPRFDVVWSNKTEDGNKQFPTMRSVFFLILN